MPQPTGRDLHVDALHSQISIAYMNEPSSYIANQALPVIYSNKQSDLIARYGKSDWFRDESKKRAKLTESAGGGFALEDPIPYFCDEWAFHFDISEDDIRNEDEVFDVEDDATQFTTEKIRIKEEVLFGTNYFKTGIWTSDLEGQTDTPSTNEFKCWDEDGSYPISDVGNAKLVMRALCGKIPNILIVSEKVHMILKNHSTMLSRIQYTQTGMMTEQLIARLLEIDKYLVARAIRATSAEGEEDDLSYILNQYGALLLYAPDRPSKRRPSAGYIVRWNRPVNGGIEGERLESTVRKFDLPLIGGRRIETSVYEQMMQIAPDCGIFFNNAIADGRTITS